MRWEKFSILPQSITLLLQVANFPSTEKQPNQYSDLNFRRNNVQIARIENGFRLQTFIRLLHDVVEFQITAGIA